MMVVPLSKPKGLLKWAYNLLSVHVASGLAFEPSFQGRKSGRIRRTVLEVAHCDAVTYECQVLVFYGERADWYRNIQAAAAVEVQVGRQRYIPQDRGLSPEEVLSNLRGYQRRYPRLVRWGLPLFGYPYDGSPESLSAIAKALPSVTFRP